MTELCQKILIKSLPSGKLAASDFELQSAPMPQPGEGEVLVETLAIGVGAGQRAGLQGSASYAGAPRTGIVMNGGGVARVVASNDSSLAAGDLVLAPTGWQTHAVLAASQLTKVADVPDPAVYVGALGTNGLTAYFGLLEIGKPAPGETVLVSAAAGSVGHIVGQIARIHGARVVGITGSEEKRARLETELGFDATVNYRDGGLRQGVKEACPDGVDVYFDNTGGDILGTALFNMNVGGRIACCGVVSQYDTDSPAPGPKGVPGLLVNKRLHMAGFLVFDFLERYDEARQNISSWINDGKLIAWQDEYSGIERAPEAFVDLLAGGNAGTRVIRVAS